VLFYITIPIQEFLERHKAPRWISMMSVFLIITIVITVLSISVIPVVTEQFQNLITRAPLIQREIQSFVNTVLNQRERLPFEVNLNEITDKAFETSSSMFSSVVANAFKIIMSTVSIVISLILVTFFFIFMLKDNVKFVTNIIRLYIRLNTLFIYYH